LVQKLRPPLDYTCFALSGLRPAGRGSYGFRSFLPRCNRVSCLFNSRFARWLRRVIPCSFFEPGLQSMDGSPVLIWPGTLVCLVSPAPRFSRVLILPSHLRRFYHPFSDLLYRSHLGSLLLPTYCHGSHTLPDLDPWTGGSFYPSASLPEQFPAFPPDFNLRLVPVIGLPAAVSAFCWFRPTGVYVPSTA